MPTPEQIQAAMPAMRRWLVNRVPNDRRSSWAGLSDSMTRAYVRNLYPGGVAQFIKDQEERRG